MGLHRIRKNDVVVVLRGVPRGRTGKVLEVLSSQNRVIVEGVNLVKKAVRKSQERPQGGIVEKENPLPLSRVQPFCPVCKKGVRIRYDLDGDRRIRRCVKCGHSFEG